MSYEERAIVTFGFLIVVGLIGVAWAYWYRYQHEHHRPKPRS